MTRHVDAPMDRKCDFDGLCFMYAKVDVMHCFFGFLDDILWSNDV